MKSLVLTLILIAAGYYTCSSFVEKTDEKFNADLWKSFLGKCSHEKYAMLGDLLKTVNLVGMTKTQVGGLLGNEMVSESSNQIEYCAGHDGKFNFNRPYHLILRLEPASDGESKVVSTLLEGPL